MSHVKVAIITGSGQGIGAGVAKSFAAAGFKVSLMSPSDRSVKLASQLGGIGRRGSVLEPKDLAALVEETRTAYGRIHAVVNNMGHGSGTPPSVTVSTVFDPDGFPDPLAFPDELWHEALDMYVLTAVRMARAVTPIMVAQGGGAIVNISSMNATEPRSGYAQMSVLRASLHGFAKLFADRYARHNVRMNNVMPGYCENVPMSDAALRSIPMGRTARFDEIGRACVFRASDASSQRPPDRTCSSTAASISGRSLNVMRRRESWSTCAWSMRKRSPALAALSDREWTPWSVENLDLCEELRRSGHYVSAAPLAPVETAVTVRVRDGNPVSSVDGPFAETEGAARRILPHRGTGSRRGHPGGREDPGGAPGEHRGPAAPGARPPGALAPPGVSYDASGPGEEKKAGRRSGSTADPRSGASRQRP